MQRYGLQLRTKPPASSSRPPVPPPRPLAAFAGADEDDVEAEILRQASKNRALQKVEEQHKKAMEEDPSVFDYDGVYDQMKEGIARPKAQEKIDRKPKYISALMEKAKQREREQEIIYERKLQKERSKDDHLYADKEKFVTASFRKKLEEQQKWLAEERLRQLREEKEDVTKKKDLSDFYFSLNKNVAFGAQGKDDTKRTKPERPDDKIEDAKTSNVDAEGADRSPKRRRETSVESETAHGSKKSMEEPAATRSRDSEAGTSAEKTANVAPPATAQAAQTTQSTQATVDHYKRSADVLAAARERALARKRAKEQQL